jgi:hypothetical protein
VFVFAASYPKIFHPERSESVSEANRPAQSKDPLSSSASTARRGVLSSALDRSPATDGFINIVKAFVIYQSVAVIPARKPFYVATLVLQRPPVNAARHPDIERPRAAAHDINEILESFIATSQTCHPERSFRTRSERKGSRRTPYCNSRNERIWEFSPHTIAPWELLATPIYLHAGEGSFDSAQDDSPISRSTPPVVVRQT